MPKTSARVESALRERIDAVSAALDKAIDGAEALFKVHGITRVATYDTQALQVEVGVLSSSGRRYLEVLGKLDQLMPMLQTLEIHEVITTREVDKQRALVKRQVRGVATMARNFASGLRRRMNEAGTSGADAAEAEREGTAQAPTTPPVGNGTPDGLLSPDELAEAGVVVDEVLVVETANSTGLG